MCISVAEKNERWARNYNYAKNYYITYGDLRVPQKYETEDGFRLGSWINTIRQIRKGKINYSKITDEQIKMLDNIGMVWDASNNNWEGCYKSARNYYQKYGNLLVPQKYIDENGVKLGSFINRERQARKKSMFYNELHIKKLNEIGMIWDVRKDKFLKREITKENQNEIKIAILNIVKDMIEDMKCSISSMDDIYCINEMFIDELDSVKIKKK